MSRPPMLETGLAHEAEGEVYSRPPLQISLVEGYDRWAATYDAPNPLHALEERALRSLLPGLRGKQVLDVGCGTGRWLVKLLAWGASSGFGLDLSGAMVRRASAKLPLQGRCVRGNALTLPFRPAVADLVISSLAVGHIQDVQAFAHELARVARSPSDVFLTDFHPEGRARGFRRTFRYRGELYEVPSIPHPIGRVRAAFEEEGFQLVCCAEPRFGEPEREIFVGKGKAHLFQAACESPALYICHFKRIAGPPTKEKRS